MELNEAARIEALRDFRILDTDPEPVFDNIVRVAARLFKAPIALVTLIDVARQWFKANVGLEEIHETDRGIAFCDHAIRSIHPMIVNDATSDPRFALNPLVTGHPDIRFYCGVPLRSSDGHNVGTLCVIDRVPRKVTHEQVVTLQELAHQVEIELELRRRLVLLEETLQTQQQQQRNKELLATMLVHDLRGPLTGISLIATCVSEEHPEAKAQLAELLDEADRMRRMLADVLDICLAQNGALRLRSTRVAMPALVASVARRLERAARERHQALVVEILDGPNTITGDAELLERVVVNLASNAMTHGPAGQPITIRVRGEAATCIVEVVDMGKTIEAAERTRIFGMFEQIGAPSPHTAMGRGLGLAFAQLAVSAHGGTIAVEPATLRGNLFRIALPAG